MKAAILGYGTVGSGAYECLTRAGYEVKKVLDIQRYDELGSVWTSDINDILSDKEIGVVAEAIGGIGVAYDFVLRALKAGKHVVTPNKHLVCEHYEELHRVAAENGVTIRFTASAGGGIPWLNNLRRATRLDDVYKIMGIMNGTTNFILDAMTGARARFADTLAQAQALGYAEQDPSEDIDGMDVARKTALSINIAFKTAVGEKDIALFSLRNIRYFDIDYLHDKFGKTIRYLGFGVKNGDRLAAFAEPTVLPMNALEANVTKNNNLISLFGNYVGRLSFYGQGAGKEPTGYAVAQDVVDILKGDTTLYWDVANNLTVDNTSCVRRYYIRTNCEKNFDFYDTVDVLDGNRYILTKAISVSDMHAAAKEILAEDGESFFAGVEE